MTAKLPLNWVADFVCSRCGKKLIDPFYVTETSSPSDTGAYVCSECCDPFTKSLIYIAAGVTTGPRH